MSKKGKEILKQARKTLGHAKDLEQRSEDFSGGPTQGELASAFLNAGNLFARAWREGEPTEAKRAALGAYRMASRYAYSSEVKEDIRNKMKEYGLIQQSPKLYSLASILLLASSLALISFNLTGGVIGAQKDNNPVSIALFVLGLAFALFYFRQKDRRK